jgi:hypothetical protein
MLTELKGILRISNRGPVGIERSTDAGSPALRTAAPGGSGSGGLGISTEPLPLALDEHAAQDFS